MDVLNEGAEGAVDLISSLAQGKVIETFVSCFDRLDNDKSDEADAIHNALSVVENVSMFGFTFMYYFANDMKNLVIL